MSEITNIPVRASTLLSVPVATGDGWFEVGLSTLFIAIAEALRVWISSRDKPKEKEECSNGDKD